MLVCFLGIIRADHHIIGGGCGNTAKRCLQYGLCTETTAPMTPNLATIFTEGPNEVLFQLQYNNSNAGWIAIGISETNIMPQSFIFLCHRDGTSGVTIQQRYATANAPPPLQTSQVTEVSSYNSGPLLNCSFTVPVRINSQLGGSIDLNKPAGYFVLLAWGAYTTSVQQHGNQMTNRCPTAGLTRITEAVGASGTSIIPTVQFIVAMLSLLFSFYIYM